MAHCGDKGGGRRREDTSGKKPWGDGIEIVMGQKIMPIAIWQTVLEHALMKRQMECPPKHAEEC